MKQIPNCADYVTTDGRFYRKYIKKGEIVYKELSQYTDNRGYKGVNLKFLDGKCRSSWSHRYIALTYIENPENKKCVNHIDHNKNNNSLDNLEWATHSENVKAAYDFGAHIPVKGEDVGVSVITEKQAIEACELLQDGLRQIDVARRLGISKKIVFSISNGLCWKHISVNYTFPQKRKTVSEEAVKWACERLQEGMSIEDILSISTNKAIDRSLLKRLKRRSTHKHIVKNYVW